MINTIANPCQRCGICCKKGGPSLHQEDRPLVESGRIPARCLFTLRRGELARDNIKGSLAPLPEEIIKIKGRAGRWTCLFYDDESRGCSIYDSRPLECRALNCRDTRRIEKAYNQTRLTRRDLLSGACGLWELVEGHQKCCSYDRLKVLVGEAGHDRRLIQEDAVLKIIRYDAHVRQLTIEKGGMDKEMLDFLFGRPLVDTIKMYGITLIKSNGKYRLRS